MANILKDYCGIVSFKMDTLSEHFGSLKPPERPKRKIKPVRNYENIKANHISVVAQVKSAIKPTPVPQITALPSDSDDDPPCGVSESLEDEIFKELERASFDEDKLNEALKNFDKILNDYKEAEEEQNRAQIAESTTQKQTVVKLNSYTEKISTKSEESLENGTKGKSKIPLSRQLLTKSKTCCIIESKCILKKSRSHDGDLNERSVVFNSIKTKKNGQVTKNTLTTKTCDKKKEFATSPPDPKKTDDIQAQRTISKFNWNRSVSAATITKRDRGRIPPDVQPTQRQKPVDASVGQMLKPKSVLQRSKSDWELGTGSRSKIPVKLNNVCPIDQSISGDTVLEKKIGRSVIRNFVNPTLAMRTKSMDVPDHARKLEGVPIHFAKVTSTSNPRLELCKVLPATSFNGTQKDRPAPVLVKDASKGNSPKLAKTMQKVISEREYQSDYSDDSGHISNEHDESVFSLINNEAVLAPDMVKRTEEKCHQPGKISGDILKYFDSVHKEEIPNNSIQKLVLGSNRIDEVF